MAIPCYVAVVIWLGWKKALLILVLLSLYALAIETFAIITGFPYSPFTYTEMIGYKLFNYTPYTVPFAYAPLFLGCIYLASIKTANKIYFIFLTALLVLWADLVLDPAAVALNFWKYQWPGIFYQVPLMNFLGWILTGTLASAITYIILGSKIFSYKPPALTSSLFLILSFWSAVCFYLELYVPALLGFLIIVFLLYETRGRVGDYNLPNKNEKIAIHQNDKQK
jgi:putative membrane protein